MRIPIALLLVVGCACMVASISIPSHRSRAEQFRAFVAKHNRAYRHSPEEYAFRLKVFLNNLEFIEEFNRHNTFQVGITQFADLTNGEYAQRLHNMDYSSNVYDYSTPAVAAPTALDWRNSTKPVVVGPVRNMGQCAASAAISVVDSVSSDYSVRFSEDFFQFNISYVTDCDGSKCSGTTTDAVWNYIKKFGLQWYFENGCPTGPGVGICITGPTCVAAGNEAALQTALASKGPISIVIDASQTSFQLYTAGVYSDAKCSSTKVNQALLLVGYGSTNGQDYWIARNEWGSSWGMSGDILIARNKNNLCGVATSACYATTAQNCMCEI